MSHHNPKKIPSFSIILKGSAGYVPCHGTPQRPSVIVPAPPGLPGRLLRPESHGFLWTFPMIWNHIDNLWIIYGSSMELVGGWPTPLKNSSQLGWWHSQLNGKKKCSKPPTSDVFFLFDWLWLDDFSVKHRFGWSWMVVSGKVLWPCHLSISVTTSFRAK